MRKAIVVAAGATLICFSPLAIAQDFGSQYTVTLSAERVFGLHWTHTRTEINGGPREGDVTTSSLTTFGIGWYRSETAFNNPRAAADVFIIDRLSLGGSLGFYVWGDDGDRQGFLFAPRVGYAAPLSDTISIWPRGGLTFFSEEDNGGGPDYSQFGLSGECMFAFFPQETWAILAGPTLDLGLTGDVDNDDFSQYSLGIHAGIMGVL
jgi:hypothetical protein